MTEVTREDIAKGIAENRQAIDALTAEHERAMRGLESKFAEQVNGLRSDMTKMVEVLEAYTAIKKGGKMIEWLSKVIAAFLVIAAVVKGAWQFLVEVGKGG